MDYADIDEILGLLKKNDRKAWKMLFQHFYVPMVMYAFKFLKNTPEAEDLVQDIFVEFCRQKRFLSVRNHLKSYLYQTVHNRCLNELGRRKMISCEEIGDLDVCYEEEGFDEEEWMKDLDLLRQEIDRFPPRMKEVFKAVVFEEKHYRTVAEEQHISVNTVKTILGRSMHRLKALFAGKDLILLLFLYKNR